MMHALLDLKSQIQIDISAQWDQTFMRNEDKAASGF